MKEACLRRQAKPRLESVAQSGFFACPDYFEGLE